MSQARTFFIAYGTWFDARRVILIATGCILSLIQSRVSGTTFRIYLQSEAVCEIYPGNQRGKAMSDEVTASKANFGPRLVRVDGQLPTRCRPP